MATTYGYGAEFSSDEDIDRIEQQSEGGLGKFVAGALAKPSRQQIEEIIDTIRQIPDEQEIDLSDEFLVGLLDYYKIQRGPVVDSTRKLYKRLVHRRIRDINNVSSNGGDATNGNNNTDNNNSINMISKRLQSVAQVEPASSDDDEPMPPVSSQSSVDMASKKKFDSRVAYRTNDKPEPMEVDSEAPVTPIGEIRASRQVDISSSEDESDGENSNKSSDSEELDITPPKAQQQQQLVVGQATKIIASTPIKDSAAAKLPPSTPKDVAKIKKPYTRSQRVATRASSSSTSKASANKPTDVSSSKVDEGQPIAHVKPLNKSQLASKFRVRFLISTLLVALVAIFIYHYRNDLTDFSRRILSKTTKIEF